MNQKKEATNKCKMSINEKSNSFENNVDECRKQEQVRRQDATR